jgi:hypothetical protein
MEGVAGANTPLLPVSGDVGRSSKWSLLKMPYCIGSRPARLILLWNFAVLLAYALFYNTDAAMQVGQSSVIPECWLHYHCSILPNSRIADRYQV